MAKFVFENPKYYQIQLSVIRYNWQNKPYYKTFVLSTNALNSGRKFNISLCYRLVAKLKTENRQATYAIKSWSDLGPILPQFSHVGEGLCILVLLSSSSRILSPSKLEEDSAWLWRSKTFILPFYNRFVKKKFYWVIQFPFGNRSS